MRLSVLLTWVSLIFAGSTSQAQFLENLKTSIRQQTEGYSNELMVARLNQPAWKWLVFQYDRGVAIDVLRNRIQSSAQQADQIAGLICKDSAQSGYQHDVMLELISEAVKTIGTQASANTVQACDQSLQSYQLGTSNPQVRQLIKDSQPDPTWSTTALLVRLEYLSGAKRDSETLAIAPRFANASAKEILKISSLLRLIETETAVQARQTLLTTAAKSLEKRTPIVGASVDHIRAGYPVLIHIPTDFEIVNEYADEQTLLALAERMIAIIEQLRAVNPAKASELTKVVAKSVYGRSSDRSSGGSASGPAGGPAFTTGDANFGDEIASGYSAGALDATTVSNFMRNLSERQNLEKFAERLNRTILSVCETAAQKNDRAILSTCANELVQKLLASGNDELGSIAKTLILSFGRFFNLRSLALKCDIVDYREQVRQMSEAIRPLIGKQIPVTEKEIQGWLEPDLFPSAPGTIHLNLCKPEDLPNVAPTDNSTLGKAKRDLTPALFQHSSTDSIYCLNFLGNTELTLQKRRSRVPVSQMQVVESAQQLYLERTTKFFISLVMAKALDEQIEKQLGLSRVLELYRVPAFFHETKSTRQDTHLEIPTDRAAILCPHHPVLPGQSVILRLHPDSQYRFPELRLRQVGPGRL